ncbi:MAG: NAD(P) transhydrogenase subunit beta [Myxococcota bacterium]|jgi:NAD(P) transhydrogenase subunit beta
MELVLLSVAYLVAAILFILSLRGLSTQESARRGNLYGVTGMVIALVATAFASSVDAYVVMAVTIGLGAAIGLYLARSVAMTSMPELVALLHSFVGAAAVLVGYASYLGAGHHGPRTIFLIEVFLAVFIGAITFTGSVVAYFKLKGTLSGTPLLLAGRHVMNLGMLAACITLAAMYVGADGTTGLWALLVATVIAGILGVHLVAAIGGADMPVVVSMLNSYSGWTASAAGFMLSNDLLIVTGALVGSSGAILSYIMCKAMNRSIWSVIFGGFGAAPPKKAAPADGQPADAIAVAEASVESTVEALLKARNVIVVPGYGMAVGRAQHAVHEMTKILQARGKEVRFGIHPVAGRLPGHMNVLLAEANVPYDIVLEMDELNADFPRTDVVLVIGANDIVNPGAQTDETSPIYGMPVLEAWKSDLTVVFKRSRRTGYAGVDNPLFYMDKTQMLFGDAKDSMDAIVSNLKAR